MAKKQDKTVKDKKKQGILSHILRVACVYYTVTTFILIFLFWLVSDDITRAMHPIALMLVLPFSICFATANTLFKRGTFGGFLAILVHYALTMGGIWLFLFLPNKTTGSPASGALILFLALTVMYALIMGGVLYMRRRIGHMTREASEYTSVYK